MKMSVFKNSFADEPIASISFEEFIAKIKSGEWKKQVLLVRSKTEEKAYKKAKSSLPAVSVSGQFKTRNKIVPVKERLLKHSGLICLDIDKKDNPRIRVQDLVDRECLAQFVSCSGEGIKIVYKCDTTKDAQEHRRIYDAAVFRLAKKGIRLKVDPIVKSIASLQYVSFDANAFYFPKTKLVIKPLPSVKKKVSPPSTNIKEDLEQLSAYIEALSEKDITKNYEDWLTIAFGLSYTLGEHGRKPYHELSKSYPGYSEQETDEMYDSCLERNMDGIEKPVTISSVFQILIANIPKIKLRNLAKKYNKSHAVGIGEDTEEQGDLAGLVRYELFLFKKVFDKETNTLIELVPFKLNLNEFEKLLKEKGFYRCNDIKVKFVHIVNNIVESVDVPDILRVITRHIEERGDYEFTYAKLEFKFPWEEIAHLWREIRGQASIQNQIAASLEHWNQNLLKDSATESFIPYQNGVVSVTAKEIKLLPYEKISQQIWKERILPREFAFTRRRGMFEEFFINVCGRGKTQRLRTSSENYKRAVWYYGYMLQGSKRQSTARAWILYDSRPGNNGRSGKTIIGQAIGKIRSMVTIDGKQIDFKNRFAFQTVLPWTDVVFIDDPSRYMSLNPLFNMITGELNADKKNSAPLVKSVKFLFASNWILEAEGSSEIGRQFVTQLDDFYNRYSKEHNDTITPIVDVHGKEFFTDWNTKDWNEFDNFSMKCLQAHLKEEAPKNTIIGNSMMVRFIQLHESELFYELASSFISNVKKAKEGGLLIPQQLLITIIKDHDTKTSPVKAGKIARDFLQCIGGKNISITSISVGGMNRMAYKMDNPYTELTFGEYEKTLPKPKF